MPLKIKAYANSHKGLVRAGNEDFYLSDDKNNLYIVCDGMGGHQAGEVASMMACELTGMIFENYKYEIAKDNSLKISKTLPPTGDILLKSVRIANHAINEKASDNPSLNGMGTTIVAMAFEKDFLSIVHVGDSRVYQIEEKKLKPLTIDHSWIAEIQHTQNISEEEASSVVGKNIITRALGVNTNVEADFRAVKVKPGDKFLLCSDGLCGFADDEDIYDVLAKVKDDNEKIVNNLIQLANDRGGSDNVTVLVAEVLDVEESEYREIEVFTEPKESKEILNYEKVWIEKLNQHVLNKNSIEKKNDSPQSKLPMMIIFAVFIIAAIAIIYYSTSGN